MSCFHLVLAEGSAALCASANSAFDRTFVTSFNDTHRGEVSMLAR